MNLWRFSFLKDFYQNMGPTSLRTYYDNCWQWSLKDGKSVALRNYSLGYILIFDAALPVMHQLACRFREDSVDDYHFAHGRLVSHIHDYEWQASFTEQASAALSINPATPEEFLAAIYDLRLKEI